MGFLEAKATITIRTCKVCLFVCFKWYLRLVEELQHKSLVHMQTNTWDNIELNFRQTPAELHRSDVSYESTLGISATIFMTSFFSLYSARKLRRNFLLSSNVNLWSLSMLYPLNAECQATKQHIPLTKFLGWLGRGSNRWLPRLTVDTQTIMPLGG